MGNNTWNGENPSSFLAGLVAFCVKDVPVCLTPEAGKVCLSVSLSLTSAMLFLMSGLLVLYQRCKYGDEYPRENVFFSFLGNLCSTVGAILSKQLYFQVLMSAFTAALDALNCILQVILGWNTRTRVRLRMRRRRRQNLVAVSLLLVVAGGFLKSTQTATFRPVSGRSLLNVSSWTPDYAEILGYILGLLGLLISCISRLPPLCRVYKGHRLTNTHVLSGILCLVAEALFTAALLHYSTQIGFLLKIMPWFLSSTSCVIIELLILFFHWFTKQQFSPDTESLLGASGDLAGVNVDVRRDGNHGTSSPTQITTFFCLMPIWHIHRSFNWRTFDYETKPIQRIIEMGRYMDISFGPSKKDNVKVRPLNPMAQMINSNCFTDTSFDSSEVSSDLEWDFEATQDHWKKTQQGEHEDPLLEWTTNPKAFTGCTCSRLGL